MTVAAFCGAEIVNKRLAPYKYELLFRPLHLGENMTIEAVAFGKRMTARLPWRKPTPLMASNRFFCKLILALLVWYYVNIELSTQWRNERSTNESGGT